MHELSIASTLVESVLEFANTPPPKKVLKVLLQIGELTCVEPDQLSFCYNRRHEGHGDRGLDARNRARPGPGRVPPIAVTPARRNIGTTRSPPLPSPLCNAPPAARPSNPPTATTAPSGPSVMSNNKKSSHRINPGNPAREKVRIQEKVKEIESLHNPSALRMLQEYLDSVLNFYAHSHGRTTRTLCHAKH